jgi:thiol-disulfide isomerase/thioredoxin
MLKGFILLLVLWLGWKSFGPEGTRAATSNAVEQITVTTLAERIARPVGRPSMVVLYATTCPMSQAMMPQLGALVRQYRDQVDFQAYSTDDDEDVTWIARFLEETSTPLAAIHVKKWAPGGLNAALSPLGIRVGDTWTRPLLVIRNLSGRIVAQGQGIGDLTPLKQSLENGSLFVQ